MPPAGVLALLAATAAIAAGALARLWVRARSRARSLEGELEQARQRLQASGDARETFFDLVTHELRSPLSAVLGYQELLRDGAYGPLDPDAHEAIDRIGRSARHLLNLIDGVVELSRLRGASLQPRTGAVDLGAVLPPVADAFRTHLRERGLEARVTLPETLPTITSDADRLTRALDLVITSAVRHPAGDALALEIDGVDGGVDLHLHETAVDLRTDLDDPTLRLGLRLAVASGLARLLGGELVLDPPDGPVVRRISFRIRDLAAAGDTPGTL